MAEKIIVYEKPTWSTCRNLAEAFRENGIEYKQVNYYIEELTEDKLRELLKKADLTAFEVLRKKEPVYKQLNINEETSPDEIIRLIVENPNLLQRPIVEVGNRAVLARPIERALELIKNVWIFLWDPNRLPECDF